MEIKRFIGMAIYKIVVWLGVINFLIDYVKPVLDKLFGYHPPPGRVNHQVTDSKGKKLNLCKVNGKLYPPIDEENITENLPNYRILPDDVLLCGYPKTGCHWVYEIIYMLRTGKAKLSSRGKEFGGFIDAMPRIVIDSLRSPRVLNSHVLYEDLPREIKKFKTKIILTTRNPKDTAVSLFHHHRNLKVFYGYDGEFPDHFELFMDGQVDYGDYFDYWLDWERVMTTEKDNPIFVVPFEELKANSVTTVMQIAEFLGSPISEKFAEEIVQTCEFSKLKKKRAETKAPVAQVYRKGIVGDWKNWLTDDMSRAVDKRWAERMKDCKYQPTM